MEPNVAPPVRVSQLATYPSPYPGSFVPMLLAAGRAVAARGWEMEVLLPQAAAERPWTQTVARQVPVAFIPSYRTRELAGWLRARFRDAPGQVVLHTHFLTPDVAAVLAGLGRPSTHVVWHKHGSFLKEPRDVVRALTKYGVLGRGVDAMLCVSPTTVGEMRRRGVPRKRVHALTNGIDGDRFTIAGAHARREARERLDLPLSATILLHFGWSWSRKGGELFLHAVRRLRDRGESVFGLTVAGGLPARAVQAELGLADDVRVVEPADDPRHFYAAADVFVAPSHSEGLPFSVLEAVSSGLPVLASTIPPHRLLADELPGVRLAGLDPEEIEQGIVELLRRDPQDAARQREASRRRVLENFTLEVWTQNLVAVYERVVAASPRPSRAVPGPGQTT